MKRNSGLNTMIFNQFFSNSVMFLLCFQYNFLSKKNRLCETHKISPKAEIIWRKARGNTRKSLGTRENKRNLKKPEGSTGSVDMSALL